MNNECSQSSRKTKMTMSQIKLLSLNMTIDSFSFLMTIPGILEDLRDKMYWQSNILSLNTDWKYWNLQFAIRKSVTTKYLKLVLVYLRFQFLNIKYFFPVIWLRFQSYWSLILMEDEKWKRRKSGCEIERQGGENFSLPLLTSLSE